MSYVWGDKHFRMAYIDVEKLAPQMAEEGKLYDDEGRLQYKGQLLLGKPFGAGKSYWPDGTIYQEGTFGIKGLLRGKEHYPNGQVRLDAFFRTNHSFGPNIPEGGRYYARDGRLVFEGHFPVRCGGVGYPYMTGLEGFGDVSQPDRPKVPVFMWEEAREAFGKKEENGGRGKET